MDCLLSLLLLLLVELINVPYDCGNYNCHEIDDLLIPPIRKSDLSYLRVPISWRHPGHARLNLRLQSSMQFMQNWCRHCFTLTGFLSTSQHTGHSNASFIKLINFSSMSELEGSFSSDCLEISRSEAKSRGLHTIWQLVRSIQYYNIILLTKKIKRKYFLFF